MVDNAIVTENARTDGRMAKSYWDVPHTDQIEGFATDISVNAGDQVDFKINVNGGAGSDYTVEIFRLGYYGGDGARMVAEWTNTDATVQPDATYEVERALVDAGNWSVTDSWDIPEDAVSGVYLARVQRLDANGDPIGDAVNQIPFIVREDDRPADIVLQTSDTTWHAYNGWGGNNGQIGANFYGDRSGLVNHPDVADPGGGAQDRAYAVSYNRPLITRGIEEQQGGVAAGAQDYLFGADYAAIHWLEQNGYDVAYMSGMDTDRLGADYLTKYQSFISVGHDEYWSGDQRANVEAARDDGVHLLFWGGNDVYWKTRWDVSIVDGVEFRTLVCYKETWANGDPNATAEDYANIDPSDIWTGTWRDTRFHDNPLAGGATHGDLLSGQPHTCNCAENSLTGQLFGPDGTGEFGGALDVPEEYAVLRVWRDTTIADGGALDIAEGILGYEWNTAPNDENRPAGLVKLSETTIPWSGILVDQGNTTAPGVATHNLTLYRAESGALVFGAGTTFWTWAFSDLHDSEPYGASIENTDLQQFTVNMFADMGIQPGVLDAVLAEQGLVRASASDDTVAASTSVAALPDSVAALEVLTISGTATDDDGNPLTTDGLIAGVEVSVDGGQKWFSATGTTNWSFEWLPMTEGTLEIMARAIDDSLNMPVIASLPTQTVTVTEPVIPEAINLLSPFETFDGTLNTDTSDLELGVRFVTTVAGDITELRYYRHEDDANDTDVRAGHLWNAAGQLIATVEFVSAPGDSGWQVAALDTPVAVQGGAQYTVSYTTSDNYVSTRSFFPDDYSEPYGVISTAGPASGVFSSGTGPVFPVSSFKSSNYWVDVTFERGNFGNTIPEITSPDAFEVAENEVAVTTVAATDDDGDALRYGIGGGADGALFWVDAQTGAVSFLFAPDFDAPDDADGDNIYELVVTASDGIDAPVQQAITVTVTDGGDATAPATLFGPDDAPQGIITNDPTDYELGTRFVADSDGTVTSLRYYRGASDANDTDTRTLNLWTDGGVNLGSVVVQSTPGQSGWQVGTLAGGIRLDAGQTYVVSYGTEQNYAFSSGFFDAAWQGEDGELSAPGGGNGVYASGGTGLFPTQSYNNTNYWVDLTFEADPPEPNTPPVITSSATQSVMENQTVVGLLTASDGQNDDLVFSIVGGADAAAFSLDADSGVLSFVAAPDFEAPADDGADNVYDLVVAVSDGQADVQQAITVTVRDDPSEPGQDASRLFAQTDVPATTATNDSSDYELGVRFSAAQDGTITNLMYYRGAPDAGDTDTRTLNLWSETGQNLGSVTVVSTPGQSGWQFGTLETPVAIVAGTAYVASYGTEQNYTFSANFFQQAQSSDDLVLTAPASAPGQGNGVFSTSGTGFFPTQSYNDTNYWVDVVFEPDPVLASQTTEDAFVFV